MKKLIPELRKERGLPAPVDPSLPGWRIGQHPLDGSEEPGSRRALSLWEPKSVKRFSTAAKEAVMGELYRQRAAECERMALKNPQQSQELRETAETWRLIAEAVEESTVH